MTETTLSHVIKESCSTSSWVVLFPDKQVLVIVIVIYLHLHSGALLHVMSGGMGQGVGDINLDNLDCTGSELDLAKCPHNG